MEPSPRAASTSLGAADRPQAWHSVRGCTVLPPSSLRRAGIRAHAALAHPPWRVPAGQGWPCSGLRCGGSSQQVGATQSMGVCPARDRAAELTRTSAPQEWEGAASAAPRQCIGAALGCRAGAVRWGCVWMVQGGAAGLSQALASPQGGCCWSEAADGRTWQPQHPEPLAAPSRGAGGGDELRAWHEPGTCPQEQPAPQCRGCQGWGGLSLAPAEGSALEPRGGGAGCQPSRQIHITGAWHRVLPRCRQGCAPAPLCSLVWDALRDGPG